MNQILVSNDEALIEGTDVLIADIPEEPNILKGTWQPSSAVNSITARMSINVPKKPKKVFFGMACNNVQPSASSSYKVCAYLDFENHEGYMTGYLTGSKFMSTYYDKGNSYQNPKLKEESPNGYGFYYYNGVFTIDCTGDYDKFSYKYDYVIEY